MSRSHFFIWVWSTILSIVRSKAPLERITSMARIVNVVNYNTSIRPRGAVLPRRMIQTTELGEVLVKFEPPFEICCATVSAL
jgi:hypothetical protein